jgi:hypothetical protein
MFKIIGCIIFLPFTIFSQDIRTLQTDLDNVWSFGLRPLSFGKQFYIESQGSLYSTNLETDFAVLGNGFFVLLNKEDNKIYLTRNGSFKYDNNGFLVNNDGMYVLNLKSELFYNNFVFITKDDFNEFREKDFNGLNIKSITGMPLLERIYPFLIQYPRNINLAKIINEQYIISEENIILGHNRIIMGALESMSYHMIDLLNVALNYFSNNRNEYDEKIKFIISLNQYILKIEKYEYFDTEFVNEVKTIYNQLKELI